MNDNAHEAPETAKTGALHETIEMIRTVLYALGIALVLRVLLFQPFTIPSASMVPNLLVGDYVIVSKSAYGWSRYSMPFSPPLFEGRIFERRPARGDVIVFKLPRDGHTDYVKRLIGLPGDRIDVRGGVLYINGRMVPRQPISSGPEGVARFRETLPNGVTYVVNDFGPDGDFDNVGGYIVPEDHYFFMGDNRDNSQDSRAPEAVGVGYVPAANLEGKALWVALSWDEGASLFKPWTWFTEARTGRFFRSVQ